MLERREFSGSCAKCKTDHVFRDIVGNCIGIESRWRIEEKAFVALQQVCLNTLSFVTIALGPDKAQHPPYTELSIRDLVGVDSHEEVHGLDDFALVLGRQQLSDNLSGIVDNFNELKRFK